MACRILFKMTELRGNLCEGNGLKAKYAVLHFFIITLLKIYTRVHNPALPHRHETSVLIFIWVKHKAPAPPHGLWRKSRARMREDMRVNKQNVHRAHWSSPRDVTFMDNGASERERVGKTREREMYMFFVKAGFYHRGTIGIVRR